MKRDKPTYDNIPKEVDLTDTPPVPSFQGDESAASQPSVTEIEELKALWRKSYEQWRKPTDPPWDEGGEALFMKGMEIYYKREEEQSKARLVDVYADIDRCKRFQQALSGQTVEESALRESDLGFIFETLADVQAKPIPWLWPHRVPRGMLTLLAGDPGEGKSYIALDMAARVSKGREWPDGTGNAPLGTTILITLEDPSEYVIKPRLDLLGADASRIIRLDSVEKRKTHPRPCQGGRPQRLADIH